MKELSKQTSEKSEKIDLVKKPSPLMAPLPLPSGKLEYTDGTNWYTLATENFVLNSITTIKPCLYATTANLNATYNNGNKGVGATLTSNINAQCIIDNRGPDRNERILVKDQTSHEQNGIYIVTTEGDGTTKWVLTRASDYDYIDQIHRGDIVAVIAGASNAVSLWMQTKKLEVNIGHSLAAPSFSRFDKSTFNNIIGTNNQILVTVTNGIATVSLASNLVLPGTGAVTLPGGNTAQRPENLIAGSIRFYKPNFVQVDLPFGSTIGVTQAQLQNWYDSYKGAPSPNTNNPLSIYPKLIHPAGMASNSVWLGEDIWYIGAGGQGWSAMSSYGGKGNVSVQISSIARGGL